MTEVLSKNYSGIMLHENVDENVYGSDANFTLEHCGCQRFLKGIVIPFVVNPKRPGLLGGVLFGEMKFVCFQVKI